MHTEISYMQWIVRGLTVTLVRTIIQSFPATIATITPMKNHRSVKYHRARPVNSNVAINSAFRTKLYVMV